MPVYEFRCLDCGRRSRKTYTFREYDEATPVCPHCGSHEMRRRIGRVALAKSEDSRVDSMMDESALAGLDEEDPRALGQFMRKMSQEMGEDLGEEFDEVVDRLEKGQTPEQIEDAMPELAEDAGGVGGGGFDDF
jgi:putative FmdB family regulatory protein